MKIALTYTGDLTKHENYVRWLRAQENIEIVELSVEKDNLADLEECQALVLSGGVDVYPPMYHATSLSYPHAPVKFREDRDRFEIRAFQYTQQRSLPVLGVCRGLQLINCIYGGSLVQDLGESLNAIHRFEQQDKAHGVNVIEDSLLREMGGVDRSVVNSAHHQAVGVLGEGLVVNCTADDGTIEGLERRNANGRPFLLCIQWHPERMYKMHLEESPLSRRIRDQFILEIKKSMAS